MKKLYYDEHTEYIVWKWYRNPIKWWRWRQVVKKWRELSKFYATKKGETNFFAQEYTGDWTQTQTWTKQKLKKRARDGRTE